MNFTHSKCSKTVHHHGRWDNQRIIKYLTVQTLIIWKGNIWVCANAYVVFSSEAKFISAIYEHCPDFQLCYFQYKFKKQSFQKLSQQRLEKNKKVKCIFVIIIFVKLQALVSNQKCRIHLQSLWQLGEISLKDFPPLLHISIIWWAFKILMPITWGAFKTLLPDLNQNVCG